MIIIYEGCDGSGKSTKAKNDAMYKECEYLHNPVDWTKGNLFEQWMNLFYKYKDKDVCIDRSFLCNTVYRDWAHKPHDFTDTELDILSQQDFSVVYCESGTEYEDASKRGEDNLKEKSDYDTIKENYWKVMRNLKKKYKKFVVVYNWHTGKMLEL